MATEPVNNAEIPEDVEFLTSEANEGGVVAGVVDALFDDAKPEIAAEYVDTDGDGKLDMAASDTNADGLVDTVVGDTDGDGKIDTGVTDMDGDGEVDLVAVDTDGDGLLAVAAVMFAVSPFLIDAAPYESTMGLIQRLLFFHATSAAVVFLAAFFFGIASWRSLSTRSPP